MYSIIKVYILEKMPLKSDDGLRHHIFFPQMRRSVPRLSLSNSYAIATCGGLNNPIP